MKNTLTDRQIAEDFQLSILANGQRLLRNTMQAILSILPKKLALQKKEFTIPQELTLEITRVDYHHVFEATKNNQPHG